MEEFARTIPLRNSVRGIAAAALDAGIPLSSGQAEQLAAVLVSTATQAKAPEMGPRPNWPAVDARASAFLTAEQLALLQQAESSHHGTGGRFWKNLSEVVDAARRADAEKLAAPSNGRPPR